MKTNIDLYYYNVNTSSSALVDTFLDLDDAYTFIMELTEVQERINIGDGIFLADPNGRVVDYLDYVLFEDESKGFKSQYTGQSDEELPAGFWDEEYTVGDGTND